MLHWLTDFSSSARGKWIVIVAWIVLAAAIVPVAPRLSDVLSNGSATFLPEGAESTRVNELVRERFPSSGTPAILVFHRDDGLTDADKQVVPSSGSGSSRMRRRRTSIPTASSASSRCRKPRPASSPRTARR